MGYPIVGEGTGTPLAAGRPSQSPEAGVPWERGVWRGGRSRGWVCMPGFPHSTSFFSDWQFFPAL